MAHTNSTVNYGLPQWIGTDKPTFLGDFNTAFSDIDTQMKANADAAASATSTANTAASAASAASTNATTALNTANSAASEAASATSAAASATATANTAATNAATALTASQANNIANLAPAYDPTLTYSVGDLVTYVDTETNTGKLYKCIIAVGAPEAFNINKWDDVTTSEVYLNKPIILNFDKNDYATADAMLTAVRTAILSIPNYASKKVDLYSGLDTAYPTFYHLSIANEFLTTPTLIFTAIVGSSYSANIRYIYLSPSTNQRGNWKMDTTGNTKTEEDLTEAPTYSILISII